jgi:hypothetical protein
MGLLDALLGHAGEKKIDDLHEEFAPLLAPDETLQRAFALIRDLIVFTDRRLILVNKQGVTAKKTEYRSIPYRAITMFSLGISTWRRSCASGCPARPRRSSCTWAAIPGRSRSWR